MAYLRQEDKDRSRELWAEAFPEDTEAFQEYYYQEKTRDNRILCREENGRVISMIHLNPYRVMVKNQIWRSDYIVGVATAKEKRRQGIMRELFQDMLADLYQEGRQFCFLMPADPAIYQPFQFTWIFDQPHWNLKESTGLEKVAYDVRYGSEHHPAQELADWMNAWLYSHYEVYTFRDEAYIERLMKELASENGEWTLLYNDSRLVGMECFWGTDKREQRMLLCEDAYMEEEREATPAIMGRIVHMPNFMKIIRLKKSCGKENITIRLRVDDPLCQENQGLWLWHLTVNGSVMKKISDGDQTGEEQEYAMAVTIDQLTSWMFGYTLPEGKEWLDWVQTLRGVFLDEVV